MELIFIHFYRFLQFDVQPGRYKALGFGIHPEGSPFFSCADNQSASARAHPPDLGGYRNMIANIRSGSEDFTQAVAGKLNQG
jgi:hypothetical protein